MAKKIKLVEASYEDGNFTMDVNLDELTKEDAEMICDFIMEDFPKEIKDNKFGCVTMQLIEDGIDLKVEGGISMQSVDAMDDAMKIVRKKLELTKLEHDTGITPCQQN